MRLFFLLPILGAATLAMGILFVSLASTSVFAQEPTMVHRILKDNETAGHQFGWNPDDNKTIFTIRDEAAFPPDNLTIIVNLDGTSPAVCNIGTIYSSMFDINCDYPPDDGSWLYYTIVKTPITQPKPISEDVPPLSAEEMKQLEQKRMLAFNKSQIQTR